MKKILSFIVAMLMIFSSFAIISVSAEETASGAEGNWEVHLDAIEEEKLAKGEDVYIPRPGYKYTDDGFEIVPPVYKNVQAKYTVISKTKYNTKNFSIKIRLDEYDASGDNWVSFSFWSEKHGLAQGNTNPGGKYGYGWMSLIRDADTAYDERDMKLSVLQGFNSGTKDAPGGWNTELTMEFEPIVDENGIQYLEFKVEDHYIYINGARLDSANCKSLMSAFKKDEYLAYFGISVKSGLANTPIKFTILEVDGVKPTGTDSAEPEVRTREFGEMIDASEIPVGTPGILLDATFENHNKTLPITSKCVVDISEDNTFKVNPHDTVGSIVFDIRDDYSVDLNDFPYITVVLKNYCICEREEGVSLQEGCDFEEVFGFFYCAGKTLAPDNDYRLSANSSYMYDITPDGSEDYYTAFVMPVTGDRLDERPNRINSLRLDYAYYTSGEEFEIMWAGCFRDLNDVADYITADGYKITVEDLGGQPRDPANNGDNGGETVTGGNYGDRPLDDEQNTPAKEDKTTDASSDESDGGCSSTVAFGTIAIVTVASIAGMVTFKKKKEDQLKI